MTRQALQKDFNLDVLKIKQYYKIVWLIKIIKLLTKKRKFILKFL